VFADSMGIDVWEAIDAASTKPFGYLRFTPGPGAGGHCLPIDPSYLSWKIRRSLGQSFRFVELANDINAHMPDYVVSRLSLALNRDKRSINGSRILLLGIAYKRNTGDTRESPGMVIAQTLSLLGADVRVVDPHLAPGATDLAQVDLTESEVRSADAVVVVTDHDDFDYDMVAECARYILDTRNRIRGPRIESL
jgi:UDP-N-acetyl-D-glucosamine dehydrogenase